MELLLLLAAVIAAGYVTRRSIIKLLETDPNG